MLLNGKTVAVVGIVIALIAILCQSGKAEDARVLPQGRSRLSFVYGKSGSITQGFNSNGDRESILGRYGAESLDLSSENLRKFNPDINSLILLLNKTGHFNLSNAADNRYFGLTKDPNDPLLGDSLSLGTLSANAEAERSIRAISYQYGVTDHLSVGFMVPLIQNKVTVNYGFSGQRNTDQMYKILANNNQLPGVQEALSLLKTLNEESFQSILAARGYQRFENYEGGGVGDAAVGGRFNYLNRKTKAGLWTNSVQSFLTAPTGSTRPTSALTQLGTGNGTFDLTTAHITNFKPTRFLVLSNSAYYTYRFANHAPTRVRTSPDDILPDASTEEMLSQKLANKAWTNVGTRFLITDALTFDASYEWFWKGRDQYQGSRTDRDYNYLSETTDSAPSYTETLQLGASVSSIPGFLRKELPVPLDFSVNLYLPTRGKNAIVAAYGTAELALYF